MSRILTTVLSLLLLEFAFYCSCLAKGEIDESCKRSDCECCFNNHCGNGSWFPNECKSGCIDGHRGARCYKLCMDNCKVCPNNETECTSCYEGFYLALTDCEKCPSNCKTCSSSTNCTTCKEGFQHSASSRTCDHFICPENCECNKSDCISCKNGYYDSKVFCNNTCPINCGSCVSSEECGACKNGYYNGYGLYEGNNILLSNCTHKCIKTCINCSSGNECQQCPNGKHGLQCQEECSAGCKDNICLIETGQCDCSTNFTGKKCTECKVGKFGTKCEQSCPVYCKDGLCDKLSGHCIHGCSTGYIIGDECNKCVTGLYGELCDKPCPENCKSRKCEKESGLCTDGCNHNFNGSTCENCIKSKYGTKCKLDCPFTCANNVCERQTGRCFSCIANFDGEMCDQCIPGRYGKDCELNCSTHCFTDTCDKDEGTCLYGCKEAYSGDKCCLNNENCLHCASSTECKECRLGFFQHSCEDECSNNCKGPCDFFTGICHACVHNRFGLFCNRTCPDNCKASRSSYLSQCLSIDGRCIFGCKEGFFGLTCNETCSSLCTGSVCTQEGGFCINGCTGSNENQVCTHSSGQTQYTVATTATFATISVLATAALFVLMMRKIIKKVRATYKQPDESVLQIHYENSFEGKRIALHDGETADLAGENNPYENIDRTTDADEHKYDAADTNTAENKDDVESEEYMNLRY